jgi:molybdopterin/thiamine biosynthesis adenylyltransferase/rhodanese-related sulfurtransferase
MAHSYREMLDRARRTVAEITPQELASRDGVVLIDVREPDETGAGVIEGSLLIPRGTLEYSVERMVPDKTASVVVYCAAGHRSLLAAQALQELGYGDVASLAGGFERWRRETGATQSPGGLTGDQRARYARHLTLHGVGEDGQRRLLEARVVVLGAGGLGSPAALYLAAAGVGTIGIVDDDVVDVSNLQRQILHHSGTIGLPKADSARDALTALNPDVEVEAHAERLTAANIVGLIDGYDVVVDGTDNFPTRYLVNDASLRLRIPVVHGSIFRFEGQATVFTPYSGPCYRCLFPSPPSPELAPSCAEAGVLGVLPGVIGSIQAAEAIKIVLGIGETLTGKLLSYDALDQSMRILRLERDPDCPACGNEDRPPALEDYDDLCRPAGRTEPRR